MTEKITVLIVDDHSVVRQGVRAFLETEPFLEVVGEAASGAEAVEMCERFAPDVVLLDLMMPQMNGVEAARRIKNVSPRSNVVILTSYHDDEYLLPAIQAGALSYLLKDVGGDELIGAVEKAARGEAVLHPQLAARIMREISGQAKPKQTHPDDLTARETEVLKLIADGLSNALIAEKLFISEKTVKSHVSNILGKLHLADRTQAAAFAWRSGLLKRE